MAKIEVKATRQEGEKGELQVTSYKPINNRKSAIDNPTTIMVEVRLIYKRR